MNKEVIGDKGSKNNKGSRNGEYSKDKGLWRCCIWGIRWWFVFEVNVCPVVKFGNNA